MVHEVFCENCTYLESDGDIDIYKSCDTKPKDEGYIVKYGPGMFDYSYYTTYHLNTKDPLKKIKQLHNNRFNKSNTKKERKE